MLLGLALDLDLDLDLVLDLNLGLEGVLALPCTHLVAKRCAALHCFVFVFVFVVVFTAQRYKCSCSTFLCAPPLRVSLFHVRVLALLQQSLSRWRCCPGGPTRSRRSVPRGCFSLPTTS
jgi:hypothetical protein